MSQTKKSYILPGEALFIAPKNPELTLVMTSGSTAILDGKIFRVPPEFAYFKRGPFGGELRVKDAALAEKIRAHDAVRTGKAVEVKSDAQLAALARKPQGADLETAGLTTRTGVKPAPETPAPESTEAPAPVAAAGPKGF